MSKSVVAFAFILLILPNSAAYAGLSEQSSLLAPGEVKLEVVGKGTSKRRADKATITLTLRCSGLSAAKARSEARTTAERLKTELIKGGVPAQAISIEPPTTNRSSFVGNEAIADLVANAGGAASPKPQPYYSSLQMKVVLMNLSLLPKAREVIEGQSVTTNVSPTLELNNIQSARNAAIQDAVRNARADAEAYAATTG